MKILLFVSIAVALFGSCDPCKEYNDDVYSDEHVVGVTQSEITAWVNDLMKEWEEPIIAFAKHEVYRLAIRSGFRRDTSYIFRIEYMDSDYLLTTKKLVANDSTEIRKIVDQTKRKLSNPEWKSIEKSLTKSNFWNLPIARPIDIGVTDAHVWILEGRRPEAEKCNKRGYHILARVEREDGDISSVVSIFTKLARTEVVHR